MYFSSFFFDFFSLYLFWKNEDCEKQITETIFFFFLGPRFHDVQIIKMFKENNAENEISCYVMPWMQQNINTYCHHDVIMYLDLF
jgi:hypothetical protein